MFQQYLVCYGKHGFYTISSDAKFTLKNVNRDKRKRTTVYLDSLIEMVLAAFHDTLEEERNIKIIKDIPPGISAILAFSIDWESILINFITNAIHALENVRAADRKIRIRLTENNEHLLLSFADSGHGLAAGTAEYICRK